MPPQDGCFVLDVPAHGVTRRTTRQSLAIAGGFLRAGDLARAEQALLQIARQDPLSGEARFFLGLIHQLRKDLETAIHHYEHALRLAPDLAEARNNLGVILQSRGRLDEAETCFREALKLEADYAEAHNNLGNALQDQGRFEEAITAYRQALHFRPGYVEALKHLGNALRALGRLTEAIACYDEGLRHAPDHALLHMSRAMVWLQSGDFARLARVRVAAPRTGPVNPPPASASLGWRRARRPHNPDRGRAGARRHHPVHPLRAAGRAPRRPGRRDLRTGPQPNPRHLPGRRSGDH